MTHARIIAELGINHNGDADTARGLIEAAAKAGVWGVKFQYRNLKNTYAADAKQIGDEILQQEIIRNYLAPSDILALSHHAQKLNVRAGISFFASADMADFAGHMDVFDFFKVPSVEFTNADLISHIEALGKPSLISTGAYTEAAITRTLATLNRDVWIPLHCVSNYPVGITNAKLGYMAHLKKLWGGPVGYSSHDEYWETCVLALHNGASVIERHITFDKGADGLDHSSSSTPDEFAKLVRFADNMSLITAGDGPRVPNQGELLNLQNLGRSFYAVGHIAQGSPVTADKLVLRTPRTGLGQDEVDGLLGKPAVRDVPQGAVIDRSVFVPRPVVRDVDLAFARQHKISLPVRFHDIADIESHLPVGRFEFHLSFGDVEREIEKTAIKPENRYSVHLPDYVSPTLLMDPFSPRPEQKAASLRVLDRTAAFVKTLQDRTGADVPVVGSFSVVHTTLDDFFAGYADLLAGYRAQGVSILPQWLPPIAWYFGGAVRLEAMNNVADAALIKKYQLPICMDVCHLCMGDKVFDFTAADVVRDLAPFTHHVHLADALGYDGEGMPFGEGDPENMDAVTAAMQMDCAKVIEVWQGHLHGGAGFATALTALRERFDDQK